MGVKSRLNLLPHRRMMKVGENRFVLDFIACALFNSDIVGWVITLFFMSFSLVLLGVEYERNVLSLDAVMWNP